MYILYIDESGDTRFGDQNNFVIGGVAIFEGVLQNLSRQLEAIQGHYFPQRQVPLAFHATDLRGSRGPFKALPPKEREKLTSEIYATIDVAGFPNLIVFATVMHVSYAENADQVLYVTFQDILQRFNTFLMRQHKAGKTNKGLVIIDQNRQQQYRQLLAKFQMQTDFGYLGNIIDIPYFARRYDTRMLQLADFCAYAVFRYYEAGDKKYFDSIHERIDKRSPMGPSDGLKHYTKANCTCEACGRR